MSLDPKRGCLSKASLGPEASAVGGAWAAGGPITDSTDVQEIPQGIRIFSRTQSWTLVKKRRSSPESPPSVQWEKEYKQVSSKGCWLDRKQAVL